MNLTEKYAFVSLVNYLDFKTHCLLADINQHFEHPSVIITQDKKALERKRPEYLTRPDKLIELDKQKIIEFAEEYNEQISEVAEIYPPILKILLTIYLAKKTELTYIVLTDNDIVIQSKPHEIISLVKTQTPFFIPELGGADYIHELAEKLEEIFERPPRKATPYRGNGYNIGFCGIHLQKYKNLRKDQIVNVLRVMGELSTKTNAEWWVEQAFTVMFNLSTADPQKAPVDLGPFGYYFSMYNDKEYFDKAKIYHCIFTKNKAFCNIKYSWQYPSINAIRYHVLFTYLRSTYINSILEIGVWRGDTSRMMLLNSINENVHYTGIDLFEDQSEIDFIKEISLDNPFSMRQVNERLSTYSDNVRLLKGYSTQTLPVLMSEGQIFDFIFIDGGHSYETVKYDFESSISMLAKDGIIFIDDYTDEENLAGLKNFITEISLSNRYEVINYSQPCDIYRGFTYSIVSVKLKNEFNIG
jgi:hypothetical protein